MSASNANPALRSLVRGLLVWSPLWILTTFLFGGLGVVYVLFLKQDKFVASQAILVGEEATGAIRRLGRFQTQAERKAAQATILEIAKSQPVVRDALMAVERTDNRWGYKAFPSKEVIEDFAKTRIVVHAPRGTEFGATSVLYLDVIANTQDETLKLSKALCDALESWLQNVRQARANDVILEGEKTELAEIQAARESSIARRPFTRLDAPIVSDRPIGPGQTTIVALCSIAGLVFGLGIVFVVTPIDASYQPLIQPEQVRAGGERTPLVAIFSNSGRDLAFQEISQRKSLQNESNTQDREETPRQKPRLAKLSA